MDYHGIARLEEARQARGTAEIAAVSEPIAGGSMCFGGPGSWDNQACGLALDGPISDAELDRLVAFYTERGVEPKVEVCPYADPSLWIGLSRRGFELREFEGVLFRELDPAEDLRALLPHGWPRGLELTAVDADDDEQLRTYVQVSSSGFRGPDEPLSDVLFELSRRGVQHPRCDSFLAVVEGQVAGAGGMETTANIACLFGTSVLPAFRRRGIQAALIARRLEQARTRGCHLVTIHTRPGIATERNARRLGFQLAYVKAVMALSGPGLVASP